MQNLKSAFLLVLVLKQRLISYIILLQAKVIVGTNVIFDEDAKLQWSNDTDTQEKISLEVPLEASKVPTPTSTSTSEESSTLSLIQYDGN